MGEGSVDGPLLPVSIFRNTYLVGKYLVEKNFVDYIRTLQKSIPRFEYKTVFACTFVYLLSLAAIMSQFVPGLFELIFPLLHDYRTSLVLSLYTRNVWTDSAYDNDYMKYKEDITNLSMSDPSCGVLSYQDRGIYSGS